MAAKVHTDVETFSRVNLRTAGLWRYWEDDSTELLCLSYAIGNENVRRWLPGEKPPTDLMNAIEQGATMYAHNAQFERLAYKHLAKRYGWRKVPDTRWRCTAAQAAALALPRALGKACAAMDLPEQKDTEGKRLLRKFAQMQKRKGKEPFRIMPADDLDDFEKLRAYCDQDVRTERSLFKEIPPLPSFMEDLWQMDLRLNERGLPIDIHFISCLKEVSAELTEQLFKRGRQLTGGIKPTQGARLLEWAEEQGVVLADLKANNVRKVLGKQNLPANVRELLEIRLEAARASVKKLDSAVECASKDNRCRGTILFHGATTGRWAGKLVQPHNFFRGVLKQKSMEVVIDLVLRKDLEGLQLLFENPMEALASVMRGIICAPNGKLLNISDYKAIEARILVWIADQKDVLALYHAGADLYIFMAAKIYRIRPEQVNAVQRKFGKDTVLGCGYQMGVDKFIKTGLAKNIIIPRKLAESCVFGYRDTMKQVVRLWGKMERAAIAAVTTGKPQHVAKCIWYVQGRFLFCKLPSGRNLSYPDPEIEFDPDRNKNMLTFMGGNAKGMWIRQRTYGGKLVENVVQGIAWDIMANGMMNAESEGFELVGTVHDEGIAEDDLNANNEEFGRALCTLPEWAYGCPIETEGFAEKRYRKG